MFTREQREQRMMAAWAKVQAKFPGRNLGREGFTAFVDGWIGGHALGAEEATSLAIEKMKELVSKVIG